MPDEPDSEKAPHQQQGDHICVFYRGNGERDRLMAANLRDRHQTGHTCLCVAGLPESAAVLSALRGTDVTKLDVDDHRLTVPRSARTPPMTGLMAEWSRATFERADCTFAKVVADMSWMLPESADVASYEANAMTLARSYPYSWVCFYDLHRVDDVLYDLIRLHTQVWVGGMVLENPYTLGPDGGTNRVPSS